MTEPSTDEPTIQDWINRCYGAESENEVLRADLARQREEIAALRGALTFTPPPGPPDLPKPDRCIYKHAVTWITNRQAICLESADLACIWMLVPGSATGPSRLETILNPEARAFAYRIKAALALTPDARTVAERFTASASDTTSPPPSAPARPR